MPILTLKLNAPGRTTDRQALALGLNGLSQRILGKQAEVTAVVIEDVPAGSWFVGGAIPALACAQLDIRVTEGTNTPAQKAEFVRQVHRLLDEQLGGSLHPVSYVSVIECPATDWGYGTLTQAARKSGRLQEKPARA